VNNKDKYGKDAFDLLMAIDHASNACLSILLVA
jgi:hypothetical protein